MREGSDAGVSDVAGTLFMVVGVVLAGGALTAVVTQTLSQPTAPDVRFLLSTLAPGDETLTVTFVRGPDLALADLGFVVERDGVLAEIPRAAWTTPDPSTLRAGDRIAAPLRPPLAEGERVTARVTFDDPPAVLATLTGATAAAETGPASASLGTASLTPEASPRSIPSDGVSATLVTVHLVHPFGAGAVSQVRVDLSSIATAAGSTLPDLLLNDEGAAGDALGGDGVWSGLLRAPRTTPRGTYTLPVEATDVAGASAGTTSLTLTVTPAPVGDDGGLGDDGGRASEGTRLSAPPASSVTEFKLRNWTWDQRDPDALDGDVLVLRVVNGTSAWSMELRFDRQSNKPCIVSARAWTATRETNYGPRSGGCLRLENLALDLIDPVAAQQLVRTGGSPHPQALYPASGIEGSPTFVIADIRDASRGGGNGDDDDDDDEGGGGNGRGNVGLFAVDVVLR